MLPAITFALAAGPYDFLSTFYPCELEIDGQRYHSVEHYYQCEKFHHTEEPPDAATQAYYALLLACDTNMKAVCLGCRQAHRFAGGWYVTRQLRERGSIRALVDQYRHTAQRVPEWHAKNRAVMRRANEIKFRDPVLAVRLRATGTAPLRYHQPSSRFWAHPGENQLGAILMALRQTLLDSAAASGPS